MDKLHPHTEQILMLITQIFVMCVKAANLTRGLLTIITKNGTIGQRHTSARPGGLGRLYVQM